MERMLRIIPILLTLLCATVASSTPHIETGAIISRDPATLFGTSLCIIGETVFVGATAGNVNYPTGFVEYGDAPHLSSTAILSPFDLSMRDFGTALVATDDYLFVSATGYIMIYDHDVTPSMLSTVSLDHTALTLPLVMKASPDQTLLIAASKDDSTAHMYDIDPTSASILRPRGLDFDLHFLAPPRTETVIDVAITDTRVFIGSNGATDGYVDAFDRDGRYLDTFVMASDQFISMDSCPHLLLVTGTDVGYILSVDMSSDVTTFALTGLSRHASAWTPSCSLVASTSLLKSGGSAVIVAIAAGGDMLSYTTAVIEYMVAETEDPHPGIGETLAITEDYVAFSTGSMGELIVLPLCPGPDETIPTAWTASSTCSACAGRVKRMHASTCIDPVANPNLLEESFVADGPGYSQVAVAGNTYARSMPSYDGNSGAVYITTLDDVINRDPVSIIDSSTAPSMRGAESSVDQYFGARIATNGQYVAVSSYYAPPDGDLSIVIIDALIDPTSVYMTLRQPAGLTYLGHRGMDIHPTELLVAATGNDGSSNFVFVFHGSTLIHTLVADDVPTGGSDYGAGLQFTESHLFVGSPGEHQVYVFDVDLSIPWTKNDVAPGGTYTGCGSHVGGTDDVLLFNCIGPTSMVLLATSLSTPGSYSVTQLATSSSEMPIACDTMNGMCAVAHVDSDDDTATVYKISNAGISEVAPRFTTSTASNVEHLAIASNSLHLVDMAGSNNVYHTTCGTDTGSTLYGMYSPRFHDCAICPLNTFAADYKVECDVMPFGAVIENGNRAAIVRDHSTLPEFYYKAGMKATVFAAKNHVVAISPSDSSVFGVFDVDNNGFTRLATVTRPGSVTPSAYFGSDLAITDAGHVIVGSATATAGAHGISIYELVHNDVVYVRSFFEYAANCEYGTAIETYGDYVAVSAPGSACNFIDVYNTADWTKVTISGDDHNVMTSMVVADTGRYLAIDHDYLYVYGTNTAVTTSFVFVIADYGSTPAQSTALQGSDVSFGHTIVPDPITDTVLITSGTSAITATAYRKGSAPGEAVLVPVNFMLFASTQILLTYYAGELYYRIPMSSRLSVTTHFLDKHSHGSLSTNSFGAEKLQFLDGLPIIVELSTSDLGLLLPPVSECAAGHEFLAPGLCRPCPDGYYSPGLQTLCTKCPPHYASNTGHTACVPDFTISKVDLGVDVMALASSGAVLAVSPQYASLPTCQTDNTGRVDIYAFSGATWTLADTVTLDAGLIPPSFCLGRALTLSDDWLAVSAYTDDNMGAVFIFSRINAAMTYNTAFSGSESYAEFGSTIQVAGSYLLVGAPGSSANGPSSGMVFIYHHSTAWAAEATPSIEAPSPVSGGFFGGLVTAREFDGSVTAAVSELGTNTIYYYNVPTWSAPAGTSVGGVGFGSDVTIASSTLVYVSEGASAYQIRLNDNSPDSPRLVTTDFTADDGYVSALGSFGDNMVTSADAYHLYGRETGAMTFSGRVPVSSSYDMADVGYILPNADSIAEGLGFGRAPVVVNDGVIFTTDAQSTALSCIYPGCAAGQHADTWYSCADCPPYTVGDGLSCMNKTYISNRNQLIGADGMSLRSVATDGLLAVLGTPHSHSGDGAIYFFIHGEGSWVSASFTEVPGDVGATKGFGYSLALSDDWIAVGGLSASGSADAVVYSRSGIRWDGPEVVATGLHTVLVAVDGDNLLVASVSGSGTAYAVYTHSEVWEEAYTGATTHTSECIDISGDWAIIGLVDEESVDILRYTSGWQFFGTVFGNNAFGNTVAVEGITMLVGAPDEGSGVIYEYGFDGSDWVLRATVTPNDPVENGAFPSSIAIHDGHVAVGWTSCVVGSSTGCVLMFDKDTDDHWQQTAVYTDPDAVIPLGGLIAVSDLTIIAASHYTAGIDTWHAEWNAECPAGYYSDSWFSCLHCPFGTYAPAHSLACYTCPTGYWPNDDASACVSQYLVFQITPSAGDIAGFGSALAVLDDIIAIGSNGATVAMYRRKGLLTASYFEELLLETSDVTGFGLSVALSDSWLVVGSPDDYAGQGAAVVYRREGYAFESHRTLTFDTADHLGTQVAITDTLLLAAAATTSGGVYAFSHDGTTWADEPTLLFEGGDTDEYGAAMAVTETYIFISAPSIRMVYVYTMDLALVATVVSTETRFGDTLAAVETASAVRLSVGCPGATVDGQVTGAVQVFLLENGEFHLENTVYQEGAIDGYNIPASLAMDSTAVVAGSPSTTTTLPNTGVVVSFRIEDGWWVESSSVTTPSPVGGMYIGQQVGVGRSLMAFSSAPEVATGMADAVFVASISCQAGQQPVSWHSCETCSAGFYSEAGWEACTACPVGSTANDGQTACIPDYSIATVVGGAAADKFGSTVKAFGTHIFALSSEADTLPAVYQISFSGSVWAVDLFHAADPGTLAPSMFPASFDVTEHWLALGSPALGTVYVYSRSDHSFDLVDTLVLGETATSFGTAVALSESVLAVGAPDSDSGVVVVYSFTGSFWAEQFKFRTTMSTHGDAFGSAVAVAPDSSFIAASDPATNSIVAILAYNSGLTGDVTETQLIEGGTSFGTSLAATETTIVVGTPAATVNGIPGAGTVTVLALDGDVWAISTTLEAHVPAAEAFGFSVAIADDTIIAGAPEYYDGAHIAGRAHLFVLTGTGDWEFDQIIAQPASDDDRLGSSVALTPQFIALGAPALDSTMGGVSVVYQPCTELSDHMASWRTGCNACAPNLPLSDDTGCKQLVSRVDYSSPFTASPDGRYGSVVAVEADTIVIATQFVDNSAYANGVAVLNLFADSASTLSEYAKLGSGQTDDMFGRSLALADSWLYVGADGAVFVYRRLGPSVEAFTTVFGGDSSFGQAIAAWGDYLAVGQPAADVTIGGSAVAGAGKVQIRHHALGSFTGVTFITLADKPGRGADALGSSLLEHDGTLFIGAPSANTVYAVHESDWSAVIQVITATLPTATVSFGSSMAYDDVYDLLLFSDPDADMFGTAQGAVVAFELDTDTSEWTQLTWVRNYGEDPSVHFGTTLSASAGLLMTGYTDATVSGLTMMQFNPVTRRYGQTNIATLTTDGAGMSGVVSHNFAVAGFLDTTDGKVTGFTADCVAGTYADSMVTCAECPDGTYSEDGARRCSVCAPGFEPTSDKAGCTSLAIAPTYHVPAGSVAGSVHFGTSVAVHDNLVLTGSEDGSAASLFARWQGSWVEIKQFWFAGSNPVRDVAMDDRWLVLALDGAGIYVYTNRLRSYLLETNLEPTESFSVVEVSGDRIVATYGDPASFGAVFSYAAGSWTKTAFTHTGSIAVNDEFFAVGQSGTIRVYSYPGDCDFSTETDCYINIAASDSESLALLDDGTLFATQPSSDEIEVFLRTSSASDPAWHLSQVVSCPAGDVASIAAAGNSTVVVGVPAASVMAPLFHDGLAWSFSGVTINGVASSECGHSVAATEKLLVCGAPALGTASLSSRVSVASQYCGAGQYTASWYECASCPADQVSHDLYCAPCRAGLVYWPDGTCSPFGLDVQVRTGAELGLSSSATLGNAVAVSTDANLFAASDMIGRSLALARFNPYSLLWEPAATFPDVLTLNGRATRIAIGEEYIVVGDPNYSGNTGRVCVIQRSGHIFQDPEFIAPPGSETYFGWQVDLSGTTLYATAIASSDTDRQLYTLDLTTSPDNYAEVAIDAYGHNFAVYGDMIVMTSQVGAVRIYPDFWSAPFTFVEPILKPSTEVTSIVINHEFILVGAPSDSGVGNSLSVGGVFMYSNDEAAAFPLLQVLVEEGLDAVAQAAGFGNSVYFLSDDVIGVGEPFAAITSWFIRQDGVWIDAFKSYPYSYDATAASGGACVIGSPGTDSVMLTFYKCPAGQYPDTVHTCAACEAGTVSQENSLVCHACPEGTSPNDAQTACIEDYSGERVDVDGYNHPQNPNHALAGDVNEGLAAFRYMADASGSAVRLFEYSTDWGMIGTLTDGVDYRFGQAIVVTDQQVVVRTLRGFIGAFIAYDRVTLEPTQLVTPPDDGHDASDQFARSMARLRNDLIAVPDRNLAYAGSLSLAGGVYLYALVDGTWELHQALFQPTPTPSAKFGRVIDAVGDTIAIASNDAVFVYRLSLETAGQYSLLSPADFTGTVRDVAVSTDEASVVIAYQDDSSTSTVYSELVLATGDLFVIHAAAGSSRSTLAMAKDVLFISDFYTSLVTMVHRLGPGFWAAAGILTIPDSVADEKMGVDLLMTDFGLVVLGGSDAVIFAPYNCDSDEVVTAWSACGAIPSGAIAYSNSYHTCPNGSYALEATVCLPCDSGTYQPNKSATACESAPAGSFVPADGYPHTAAIECPLATAQAGSGATYCSRSYEIQTITGSELFGASVALDGPELLVGSPSDGAIFVYSDDSAVWTPAGSISPLVAVPNNQFAATMVIRDDWLAVGAPDTCAVSGCSEVGRVYMFSRTAGVFTEHSVLEGANSGPGFEFGAAIALEGTLLAVLAPGSTEFTNTGTVVLFELSADTWVEHAHIDQTVFSLSASSLFIGSTHDPVNVFISLGAIALRCAYTPDLSDATCTIAPEFSGFSAAATDILTGVVATANSERPTGDFNQVTDAGTVRVYTTQFHTLDIGPVQGQQFGQAIAVSGTLVGATDVMGGVHLFELNDNGSYSLYADVYLTDTGYAPVDGFGAALAITPLNLAAGSSLDGVGTVHVVSMVCPAGQYATSWHTCADCAAGTYTAIAGQRQCLPAPLGTSSAGGQATPTPCDGGHYTIGTGASSCSTCAFGTTNDADGAAHTTCLAEVDDSESTVTVTSRTDISGVTIDGIAATVLGTNPITLVPVLPSPDGVIAPGNYTLEIQFDDSTTESTTLTIPADFETPDTTLTLSGTTMTAAMESAVCPSNLDFSGMGTRPLTGVDTSGPSTCLATTTVNAAMIRYHFSPTVTRLDNGTYCASIEGAAISSVGSFSIVVDGTAHPVRLVDGSICTFDDADDAAADLTTAYIYSETRSVSAMFDDEEIVSDSEIINTVDALYAIIPGIGAVLLILLCCMAGVCIVGSLGLFLTGEAISVFILQKRQTGDDEEHEPTSIVTPAPMKLKPTSPLPPLPMLPGATPLAKPMGPGLHVPAGAKPVLPSIKPPMSGTPIALSGAGHKLGLPALSTPGGLPKPPPSLGKSGLPVLPPMNGMPRPGAKLMLSPMNLPGIKPPGLNKDE
ncbi:FG-GAP repeat [Carpediemonas membranifera]|uniref:FG-GAP repeat n=1 Tax=Carpediemonas membranifera TaxID=201153 RepID=A0A8J6BAH3_9EUKA|nr:FG-GAP repeat [Carpediemonas membranifera]|eukprot:KAG9393327.1 FG-GAP repeat [Carpediemonas membranifera]